jgi:hypothetical protein
VLTVNQVVSIMVSYSETRDWKIAFEKVIPTRKQSEKKAAVPEEAVHDKTEATT